MKLVPLFFPFFLTLFLSPLFKALALKLGFLDDPSRGSKIHQRPIPYLGGMAIFSSFLLSLAIFNFTLPYYLLVSVLAFLLLGTLDDLLDIRALYRLPLQFLFALVTIYTAWRFPFIPIRYLNSLLVVLFIMGAVNSFNCWDVVDGSAGATSLAIAFSLLIYSFIFGKDIPFLIVLIGCILGWLPHNLHPASMFMGDGGSYFLSAILSATALQISSQLSPLQGLLPLFPFIYPCLDFIVVHYKRYRRGVKKLKPLLTSTDKDHLPHRLLAKVKSVNLTSLLLFFLVCFSSLLPIIFSPHLLYIPFALILGVYFILDRYLPPALENKGSND
ncbi:undecaprenyl/decaprenyl-phosphate alpha-N-acetylglucosaminyl 1-phosphate transferase [bacterium]|nr:undecaprenyl/decaprenyl-phosphate alpha-N-acetylglucosaminyl 1-phosphate transferase [bacterium]